MTNRSSRRLYYWLRKTVAVGGTAAYVLMNTGIMDDSVQTSGVKSIVWMLAGWAGISFIKDYHKRATAKENPNAGEIGRATALFGMIPWIVVMIAAGAIQIGIANIFQHILVISSMQIGGKIFEGFEIKYDMLEKREAKSI